MGSHDQIRSNLNGRLNGGGCQAARLQVRASQGAELVALERGREIGGPVTNHSANREELQGNPSIQQRGPLNTDLHPCSDADFVR
jgi:hypothetical protein